MINTFNLEQNLLTFPSERDVLTGGGGGVSATGDGWLDARLLTCPSQRACSGPPAPCPGPHAASVTEKVSLANGTYNTVDSSVHQRRREALSHTPLRFWLIPRKK